MHQGKILSRPNENGPGRILGLAQAFTDIPDTLIPRDLMDIHENARKTINNNYVMGPLEQYILYHWSIAQIEDFLKDLLRDSITIFVPSLSVDMPFVGYKSVEDSEDEFAIDEPIVAGMRLGLGITSNMSYFGGKLVESNRALEGVVEAELKEAGIKNTALAKENIKRIVYIPIAPILSVVCDDGNTIRNIFGDYLDFADCDTTLLENVFGNCLAIKNGSVNIVESVSNLMISKHKEPMGSTIRTEGFENPFYYFMPSFFDADLAQRIVKRKPDTDPSYFREELLRHTRYTRFITAQMYAKLMSYLPSGKEVYLFIAKSSKLYDIAEMAVRPNGLEIHDVKIMRNKTFPLLAEAEASAFRILRGYLTEEIMERLDVKRELSMKVLFG